MRRLALLPMTALLLTFVTSGGHPKLSHPDYVPDEKTAARIAEAVLAAQYGQARVNLQLPLLVAARGNGQWVVQGHVVDSEGHTAVGGGFGVLLNKHDGCILELVENMK